VLRFAAALDLVGLLLLVCGIALVLVPLTLNSAETPAPPSSTESQDGSSGQLVRALVASAARSEHFMLFVIGVVLLLVFAVWESRFASSPVIAPAFVQNKNIIINAFIGFADFVSILFL
jgi:hypothetical protein